MIGKLEDHAGATSRWSLLEISRGFLKRKNLGEIDRDEAEEAIDFFLVDILELEARDLLQIVDVKKSIVSKGLHILREHNLYAADSIHYATALETGARLFLADDSHYKRMRDAGDLDVLPVDLEPSEFKEAFQRTVKSR